MNYFLDAWNSADVIWAVIMGFSALAALQNILDEIFFKS